MSTFGYYPGPIDYWMLITDWRNGSVAIILLAIAALVAGYAFRTGSPVAPTPTAVLPTHASPTIAKGEDEGDAGQTPRPRAVQKMGH